MMKKNILQLCYYINIFMLVVIGIVVIAVILRQKNILDFIFFDKFFLVFRMLMTIPVLILWIYNIKIWSRRDKQIRRFLLLFFFNGLYNPFYYRKAVKSN